MRSSIINFGIFRSGKERGATTILLAFFVMGVLLMMALTAASIMIYQIQLSKDIANSITAFYAADAGAEECLYQARKGEGGSGCTIADDPIQIDLTNSATAQASISGGSKIISSGSFGGTKRTVELEGMAAPTPTPTPTPTSLPLPTNLTLSHATRAKPFLVSWTAGGDNGGAGGCKLQFNNISSWADIAAGANVNCDADSSGATYDLNASGWKANWDGTQVRLVRKSDLEVMGVFPQSLACAATAGSGSPTPTIDEDCDGNWDNTVIGECLSWGTQHCTIFYYGSSNCTTDYHYQFTSTFECDWSNPCIDGCYYPTGNGSESAHCDCAHDCGCLSYSYTYY